MQVLIIQTSPLLASNAQHVVLQFPRSQKTSGTAPALKRALTLLSVVRYG